ncbi:acidic mammalian chitinase-like [Sabethes cyaneus]|uniref:acidic mammalian chitinase-like n=1 Tax=Sabethes cyaneus TaxID=53552 RepID=UPI00237ED67D|nr:acidic mammalian chitinase-like [Sabethes cyaneus]
MVYQHVQLASNGLIATLDLNVAELQQFVKLKSASNVKVLVAIGGPKQSSKLLSSLFVSSSQRVVTANAILSFLTKYDLDGVDFHWQWPVLSGGNPEDRVTFPKFLQQLQLVLKPAGKILSISVAPTKDHFLSSYDVAAIDPLVDYVNVMAFDLHAFWDAQTGHNAPVYRAVEETTRSERELNIDFILTGWIATGISPSKIILGVSTNGHSFRLADASVNGIRDRTVGAGPEQKYTLKSGDLNYLEACEMVREGGWTTVWDTRAQAYYTYKGTLWVSFESQASLEAKMNLARSNSIGGLGMWNMEGDDVKNICGGGRFTLLSFIASALLPASSGTTVATSTTAKTTTTTAKTTTTTAKTTTTTTTQNSNEPGGYPAYCPTSGFVRDPYDCSSFYRCTPGSKFVATGKQTCANGLKFDTKINVCNYAASVVC